MTTHCFFALLSILPPNKGIKIDEIQRLRSSDNFDNGGASGQGGQGGPGTRVRLYTFAFQKEFVFFSC